MYFQEPKFDRMLLYETIFYTIPRFGQFFAT